MPSTEAVSAANRFGLGARPGELGRWPRVAGALLKGVLASRLRVSEAALETKVFPDRRDGRALEGSFA